MTVIATQTEQKFKASEFLWGKRELVDAIVREALISQTEAFVDMIVDGQEDLSRAGIQETLKGVKESAEDFLSDLLGWMSEEDVKQFCRSNDYIAYDPDSEDKEDDE